MVTKKDEDHKLVLKEIEGIPKDIRPIFMPSTKEGIKKKATNIRNRQDGHDERWTVHNRWLSYKNQLPLKARRWSLRYITIRINIIEYKRDMEDG
jgi:hypothetical protein